MPNFDFGSLGAFAKHLEGLAERHSTMQPALEHCAQLVEQTAKSEFGEYQPGTGHYQAWPELAESTRLDRERQGYPADEPLLRDGKLRDSISHQTSDNEAVIGSTNEVMVYQELGTASIPPRPVLGPALVRNEDEIMRILGNAAARSVFVKPPGGGVNIPAEQAYGASTPSIAGAMLRGIVQQTEMVVRAAEVAAIEAAETLSLLDVALGVIEVAAIL